MTTLSLVRWDVPLRTWCGRRWHTGTRARWLAGTRGDYDAKPPSNEELRLLESAGTADGVRVLVLVLTERSQMERVLDLVVQGNTAQMAVPAFVKELKAWIRFNDADAVRTGDGLCSVSSGNLCVPSWIGDLAVAPGAAPAATVASGAAASATAATGAATVGVEGGGDGGGACPAACGSATGMGVGSLAAA